MFSCFRSYRGWVVLGLAARPGRLSGDLAWRSFGGGPAIPGACRLPPHAHLHAWGPWPSPRAGYLERCPAHNFTVFTFNIQQRRMKWKIPNLISWHLAGPCRVPLLCFSYFVKLLQIILPGWQITHGWLMLFSTAEAGSLRNLIDGVIFSAFFGWVTAAVLVMIYNRLVRS